MDGHELPIKLTGDQPMRMRGATGNRITGLNIDPDRPANADNAAPDLGSQNANRRINSRLVPGGVSCGAGSGESVPMVRRPAKGPACVRMFAQCMVSVGL